jgi:multimeric flavodoxin WrbA
MKVAAFNGSARKDGNTALLIKYVLAELEREGIETELVQLAGKTIRGCIGCRKCAESLDQRCSIKTDFANECIEKMIAADAIILGSPTYFADVTADMKGLIERAGMVAMANGGMFARKIGAAVVAVRRGGAIHAFDSLNHFFFISQMIVPGSTYWNVGIGRESGEVENDAEGRNNMANLGQHMAWLLKKIKA